MSRVPHLPFTALRAGDAGAERSAGQPDAEAHRQAFDALYEAHAGFVWRMLRSLGVPRDDVEDTAQEVFLIVHRKLATYEGRSSLRTWICGITVGVARNHVRKVLRRAGATTAPPPSSDTALARSAEALELVTRCLADLEEPLRLVFVLAELQQLTAPEIAEALGLNVNTVYSRLRTARERFEASVAIHGGEP